MNNKRHFIGNLKISGDPEAADELRQLLVPHYYQCGFRSVLAKPYDHQCDDTLMFVECRHPESSKETEECLGQCALDGKQYGKNTLKK